jgi:hypothetical protein
MTVFIVGLILGGFLGALIASKPFRTKVIDSIKKLSDKK